MNGNRDIARHLMGQVWSAFALLTVLPVPNHSPAGAKAAWAWPLVGAVLGVLSALVMAGALLVGLPAGIVAVLGLGTMTVATAALHEDGLADTADGFFGGRTPEKRLEIMKDSRNGSFAGLALIMVTLARWSALAALAAQGGATTAVIVAATASRVPMVALMATLPNARGSGLSQSVGRPDRDIATVAAVLAIVISFTLVGWATLWLLAGLVLLTIGVGRLSRARIGGQTGDVLGASQQLADLFCLAVLAAAIAQ